MHSGTDTRHTHTQALSVVAVFHVIIISLDVQCSVAVQRGAAQALAVQSTPAEMGIFNNVRLMNIINSIWYFAYLASVGLRTPAEDACSACDGGMQFHYVSIKGPDVCRDDFT